MRASLFFPAFPAATIAIACGPSADDAPAREVASAAPAAAAPKATVDACALVTQAEAAELFGEAADREQGVTVTDPAMIGECIWEHETPAGSHQLQVRVWGSPQYYTPTDDDFTRPLEVGERGYVRVHSASGVDIAWVQGGRVYELSYFTVGAPGFPKATERVGAVTALARRTSSKL
jgi:hypothetical protein